MNKPYKVIDDAPGVSPVAAGSVVLPSTSWQIPDPSVLRSGRRKPPDFPIDVLGPWKDWALAAAEGANAPVDYTAANLLAAAAALIGSARQVEPWRPWTEPCVLWIGVVGDPSSGKSPAADPIFRAVGEVERGLALDFDDVHREWATKAEDKG